MKIKNIAIIGLGLIGGSLAAAIKNAKLPVWVVGASRRAITVKKALKRRFIDEGTIDLSSAVKDADLVFICTPISRIIPTLRKIAPCLKDGAIVTDVGSTKAKIVFWAEKILAGRAFFVGGHPMAGSERTGIDAASEGLFEGRPYILTRTKTTNREAMNALETVLKKLGVKILRVSCEAQDLLVAGISHLPLAVAASLVNTIASLPNRGKFASVASSGFRDSTRVASGDPSLGADIFATNKDAVLKMLRLFKLSLTKLEARVKRGDKKAVLKLLTQAKAFRDRMHLQ